MKKQKCRNNLWLKDHLVVSSDSKTHDHIKKFVKPLIVFLRIVGVPLIGFVKPNPIKDRCLRCMGLLFFVVNVVFGIVNIKSTVDVYLAGGFANSSTFTSSVSMAIITNECSKIGNHLTLLLLAGSIRQKKLIQLVIKIISFSGLKIQKSSFSIVIIFILVSLIIYCNKVKHLMRFDDTFFVLKSGNLIDASSHYS